MPFGPNYQAQSRRASDRKRRMPVADTPSEAN